MLRALNSPTTPPPLPEIMRSLEIIAARRSGITNPPPRSVSWYRRTPSVFLRFLKTRFNASARKIEQVDMRDRRMMLGELYAALI
jgi:hypothetical protein